MNLSLRDLRKRLEQLGIMGTKMALGPTCPTVPSASPAPKTRGTLVVIGCSHCPQPKTR